MRKEVQKQWDNSAPAIELVSSFIERGAVKLQKSYNDEDNYSSEQLDAIIDSIKSNIAALNRIVESFTTKDV